ncbi:MAG: hypothetical protein JXQ73_01950 [Phycisphaerae bacterium]|nr:hypothetical protein [Phycisphaerae bacterium]
MIAETSNVRREPGLVKKHPGNPIIRRDKPWDASRADLYGSAVWDPVHRRLQVFYSANNVPNGHEDRLAYAESLDGGKTWVKPEFDMIPYRGHKRTNLVLLPPALVFAGPCVFRDEHETDPAKRYKLFTSSYPDTAYLGVPRIYTHRGLFLYRDETAKLPEGCGEPGMYIGTSADGIHWRCSARPFSNMLSDTTQSAFWDGRIGKYVAYVRARTDKGRSVARMESADFNTWSEPKVVLEGAQAQSLYSLGVTPYQGMYIGTPWIFDQPSEAKGGPVIWPELAFSRDGIRWQRLFAGTPLVRPGPKGSPDSRQIRLAGGLVVLEDRILLFYGQTDKPHTTVDMQVDIGMATLRLDGFASMTAGDAPGSVLTRPLALKPGRLWVNAEVSAGGYVKAAILDEKGRPVDGYSEGDCVGLQRDSIGAPLAWRDKAEIEGGGRIRFALRCAKLYSFWIER